MLHIFFVFLFFYIKCIGSFFHNKNSETRMDGGRMNFVNVDKLFFSSLILLIMKTDFCRLLGSLFKNLVFFLLLIDNILKGKIDIYVSVLKENQYKSKWKIWGMVFCYQICSDLLWEKIVLVIEKNFWNSRLKAENLQKNWDH